jgi:hypothetical protein
VDACTSGKQLEIIWRARRANAVEVGGRVCLYGAGNLSARGPYPVGALWDGAFPTWLAVRSGRRGGRNAVGEDGLSVATTAASAMGALQSARSRAVPVPRPGPAGDCTLQRQAVARIDIARVRLAGHGLMPVWEAIVTYVSGLESVDVMDRASG